MKDILLPIGSIIVTKGVKVMIVSYIGKGELFNNVQYDYVCCLYPYGLSKDAVLVKKDEIEKVIFIGYQDNDFDKFEKEGK